MRSESPSGKCAKLHTMAASNNRDHATSSLFIAWSRHKYIGVVLRAHSVRGEPRIQRNASSLSLSLLVVRRFDDDTAQRFSLCRRMWLLSPKAEAQTRPHTVKADPCGVVVGCGWLRCWCLRARFATATSICCCSKVASPLTQTACHSSRSPANSSSLSKGIPHLLEDDLM